MGTLLFKRQGLSVAAKIHSRRCGIHCIGMESDSFAQFPRLMSYYFYYYCRRFVPPKIFQPALITLIERAVWVQIWTSANAKHTQKRWCSTAVQWGGLHSFLECTHTHTHTHTHTRHITEKMSARARNWKRLKVSQLHVAQTVVLQQQKHTWQTGACQHVVRCLFWSARVSVLGWRSGWVS